MSTCTVDGFHLSIWSSFPDRNIVCFLLFPFSPSQLPYMAYGRTMVVEAVSPPLLHCWVMFATTTTTYVPPSGFSTKLCANCLMLNSSPRLVLLGILYDNIRLVALLESQCPRCSYYCCCYCNDAKVIQDFQPVAKHSSPSLLCSSPLKHQLEAKLGFG